MLQSIVYNDIPLRSTLDKNLANNFGDDEGTKESEPHTKEKGFNYFIRGT